MSNEIDTDYHQMDDNDNDDDELGSNLGLYTGQTDEKEEKKSGHGYHLPRVAGISVLTFLVALIALFINDLSSFSQSVKRVTTDNQTGEVTSRTSCKVKGICGYAKGEYKYTTTKGLDPSENCPAPSADDSEKYTVNYSKECDDDYNGACRAMNAGNAFVVFGIFALLFGLILMIIIVPMCFQKRCFPLSCVKYLKYILGILFAIVSISNFLSGVIWIASNSCDNADKNYKKAFDYQSDNTPGVSTILMLLCFVANLVGFGAVCCCWMDHKQDREDFWNKKDDPEKNPDDYYL